MGGLVSHRNFEYFKPQRFIFFCFSFRLNFLVCLVYCFAEWRECCELKGWIIQQCPIVSWRTTRYKHWLYLCSLVEHAELAFWPVMGEGTGLWQTVRGAWYNNLYTSWPRIFQWLPPLMLLAQRWPNRLRHARSICKVCRPSDRCTCMRIKSPVMYTSNT